MNSFKTEFGHTIPFVPGYFDRNKAYAYYAKGARLHEGLTEKKEPIPFNAYLKDWVEFSSLAMFMLRFGLLGTPKKSGLDLGGAEGACIRLFKAAGFIEEAYNLDIDDYSSVFNDDKFREVVDLFRNYAKAVPKDSEDTIRQEILAAKWGFDHYPEAPYLAGLINQFPRDSNATDFHMDVMDAPGTYDLVTSYFCFDYLDLNRILPKVRSLLNPGGVFAGMFEYWWWPINSTGIIGHFPYAGARLSFKDLERYHAEHHPDLIENLYFKYHYFHEGKQRPTVDEWFSIAKSHGLKPIAFERIVL